MTGTPRFVVNAEAAVYRDGEYLLAERSAEEDHAAGALSLIGGKVERSEPSRAVLAKTVRRELREEVGVEVDELEYVTSAGFESDTGDNVVNVVFLASYAGGTARPREPEEVAAVHWRTLESIRSDEMIPAYIRAYIDQVEERRTQLAALD